MKKLKKKIKINKLQKDLFQSQEILNKLQKDKNKELSITFNSIKSLDNLNNFKKDYQLSAFFVLIYEKNDRILDTNFNKFEMNKSIKKINNLSSMNNNSKSKSKNKHLKGLLKIYSIL